jgi:hypothetical protein
MTMKIEESKTSPNGKSNKVQTPPATQTLADDAKDLEGREIFRRR